jgi:UDP-N-acetylmuramyl pentapeptide phosphotransferase/UDP-N-acetylglucosamine-1-phosphate transferase
VGRPSLLTIIYIVIGIVIAANRNYFDDIDGLRAILSAVLAVLLWPLVLLGVDLDLGRDGREKDGLLIGGWLLARLTTRRRAA